MEHTGNLIHEKIDTLGWPAMPDPFDRDQTVWIWPRSRIRAYEQTNPRNAHGEGYLHFPYALAVFDGSDRHILSVVLEQTDFRVLSQMTGERISDLSGGIKGHLSPLMLAGYDANGHDEFGLYEGSLVREAVMEQLVDLVADKLDLWDEPMRKNI
jgi:hypothetical protein